MQPIDNTITQIPLVIIEPGRALRMCDFVPIGQNVQTLQGPLNLPTKVGIQMQILKHPSSVLE